MNRRTLLQLGAAGALAGGATSAAGQSPAPHKLRLDAYSRTLHWLRTPGEVAEACHQIGATTIDLTVRTYPGHVDPARVRTDLPPFVEGLRRGGITVTCMAAEITDASTPHVEAMLETAASLGIRHHWWRGFAYDPSQPYAPQLEAFKPRVAGLAKLNEKYGMKALYHPGGGFSGAFFDLLEVLKGFDPRYVAIQYDTGNLGQISPQNLVTQLKLGAPYIGGFVFKDFVVEKGVGQPRPPAAFPADMARPASPPPPAPRAGNGWGLRQVPVGTGMLNLAVIARTLREIGFDGPMECQPEWPELGGANQGLDKLTIPPEQVIALLRRDRLTVESALAVEGLI